MLNRLLFLSAVLFIAAGSLIAVLAFTTGGDDAGGDLAIGPPLPTLAPTLTPTQPPLPTEEPTEAPPTPTPTPPGDPRLAALDIHRLVVPKLEIDAPIITLGLKDGGVMESPGGPEQVAWYDFSAKPGEIGNVVMAGHLDYINYGGAVFWRLRELRPGDDVQLVMEDGTRVHYTVESVIAYDEATAPVRDIVGPTAEESITLITCAGSFDPNNRLYDKRLVVRGARVLPETAESPPSGG